MIEHNLVDILIARLASTADASFDLWKAHAQVLHESLEHHIKEEESTLFEELGEHFPDSRLDAMGVRYLVGKKMATTPAEARGHGTRKRAGSPPA